MKYQTATIAAGIYTVKDWRQMENRPPIDGGDKVLVSANLRDINDNSAVVVSTQKEGKEEHNNEDGDEK